MAYRGGAARARAARRHELDRHEVEESVQEARHPELGRAVEPRMVDRADLRHPEARVVREHRDEAMELTVEPHLPERA